MSHDDMDLIFEQINNLKRPAEEKKDEEVRPKKDVFADMMIGVSESIQSVLQEHELTQERLCEITGMSQSNLSKILNGKVVPRIETLQKIASATHTKLVIGFESSEGDDE